jgi:glycosyltransferase involved in cell wall biosynthesis
VLHFHMDYWPFSLFSRQRTPFVTTLHGRLDLPELQPIFDMFPHVPVVSISDSQRRPLPQARFVDTVLHGVPEDLLTPQPVKPEYLAFLGRICPEKCPDRAIEIARRAGIPLKIAAKVDRVDQEYFDAVVRPLLRGPGVEMIGEISDREKSAFLSGAIGLLLPIDWPEPFGLVMIEAMACGTPVVAFNRGSVPEVVDHGVTGFIVEDDMGAIAAIDRLGSLSRRRVREQFEARFTARRMAEDYLDVYCQLGVERRATLRVVG